MAATARLCALLSLSLPVALAAAETEPERLDLRPDEPAGWSATHLFAPITGLFLGGPGYWYEERRLEIETTPPHAVLDLFYVRRNFQKRYEQTEAPVVLRLPSRIQAGDRDSVTVRAMMDGYQQEEIHLRVRSRETKLRIELEPLPNQLVALTHTVLAGRGTLTFLTTEQLTFRMLERDDGFGVVLVETGRAEGVESTVGSVSSGLVSAADAQQLGQDLLVEVRLAPEALRAGMEPRSRQNFDAVRGLHGFSLDLVPPDGGASAVERARAALARIRPDDVTGCALDFDRRLREQLDPAALSRALSPQGAFTDPYLRAALRRLGEVSAGGVIEMKDGSTYRPAVPIELAAAGSHPADAVGYLALLRAFVAELEPPEHRRATLRGLVAPEIGPSRFDEILDRAEAAQARCSQVAGS